MAIVVIVVAVVIVVVMVVVAVVAGRKGAVRTFLGMELQGRRTSPSPAPSPSPPPGISPPPHRRAAHDQSDQLDQVIPAQLPQVGPLQASAEPVL